MKTCTVALAIGLVLWTAGAAGAAGDDGKAAWCVAENNGVVAVYAGKIAADKRELVFELKEMKFYSNQRLYGCIFVNGRIVSIKEYNTRDSYVRGFVSLGDDKEIAVYAGVIKAPEKIDPHDHAALWQAFVRSPHKPFRAKVSQLPAWYVTNPIRAKKLQAKAAQPGPVHAAQPASGYPYLKPDQRPQKAREALDPATGDRARFRAVWGLAISGYCPEGAGALATIATDTKYERGTRVYAGMGLRNFSSAMPKEMRQAILERLRKAFRAEKDKLPDAVTRTLIAWGDADYVHEALGKTLRGHPMEIEVLQRIRSREQATRRLLEMAQAAPKVTTNTGWHVRWRVGAALIGCRDSRGIDLMIECLVVREPWPTQNPSPAARASNDASFRQSISNTYTWLARAMGRDFGYRSNRWTPQLAPATEKMVAWWQENRQTFQWPQPDPAKGRPTKHGPRRSPTALEDY